MARDSDNDEIPGIERLLALTDGVVAIALTLLVLQLQVPITDALKSNPKSASALWDALSGSDGSEFTSYAISFFIIAQFWLVHHRVLRSMRGHNEGLAWRNFGFLLTLTLMPFSSDLLGRYGDNPVAITIFGVNLAAISLTTQWIFLYANRHNLLTEKARSFHAERAARVRAVLALLIVALAIFLAWVDERLSRFAWLLFLLMPIAAERITSVLERSQPVTPAGAGG